MSCFLAYIALKLRSCPPPGSPSVSRPYSPQPPGFLVFLRHSMPLQASGPWPLQFLPLKPSSSDHHRPDDCYIQTSAPRPSLKLHQLTDTLHPRLTIFKFYFTHSTYNTLKRSMYCLPSVSPPSRNTLTCSLGCESRGEREACVLLTKGRVRGPREVFAQWISKLGRNSKPQ